MTTNFKLATTTIYQPRNVQHAADSTPASHSRTRLASDASSTGVIRPDTTALKVSTDLSASAITTDANRSTRIEALRQSIAAGTYSVPAYDVASSIVDALL